MLKIGTHLSSAKGFAAMGRDAAEMDANTFQFFTRNPRGGNVKEINREDINTYHTLAAENGIGVILAHAPYTMNLCGGEERVRDFGARALAEDLSRMEYVPGNLYNFHPGSHVGQGAEAGISLIAGQLNNTLWPEMTTTVLLETMAGKGTEIGRSFEELREIINRVTLQDKLGVCLDTCHVYDAGYDIVGDLDGVLAEFDRVIGLERLKAVHLNDSKNPMGSHKDRHELMGKGTIGEEALARVINHPALRELPFYLETPTDNQGHAEEIARLKALYREQ